MGTWGEGPFDNDAAGDLSAAMMRRIEPALGRDEREARYHYHEARAAAQFVVLTHGTDILGGPGLDRVVYLLVRMRTDVEWLAEWREPKKIATALDKELDAIFRKMRECKSFSGGTMLSALEQLAKDARRLPIPKSTRPKLPRSRLKLRRRKPRRRPAT